MRPQKNQKYLAFVRSQPCAVCGSQRNIEAAHTGARGLGQKSSDFSAIPLCAVDHRTGSDSYHRLGPKRFTVKHALDIPALVAGLNAIGLRGLQGHAPSRREDSPEFSRSRCICGWRSVWYRLRHDALAALHHHIDESSTPTTPIATNGVVHITNGQVQKKLPSLILVVERL